MDKAEKCLERRNNKRKIYYRTEKGYNLVNQAQEMITRERCVVLDEKQILIRRTKRVFRKIKLEIFN